MEWSSSPDPVALGLRWSAVGSIGVRLISGARGLVIARLVGPHSLGEFAAAFAFASFANMVADVGLQTFLVSRGRDARAYSREVFELAAAAGLVSAVVLAGAARPLAALYDDRAIAAVAIALSALVLLTSLSVVPNALLRVEMRFKEVARAQLTGEIAALVVGLSLAAGGAGVWALVFAAIANQAATAIVLWIAAPESARRGPRMSRRRSTLGFGATVALGAVVWSIALQGDNVAVGKLVGATALGLYAFAYNYGVLPGVAVGGIVTDVAFASFAKAANDDERRALFLRFSRVTAAVSAPVVAVSVTFAPQALRLVLGEAWLGAVRPLQMMLVLGFVRGLLPAEALLRAARRVDVELKIGLVAAPLTVVAAVALAHRGIAAVAVGVVGIQVVAAAVSASVSIHHIGLTAAPLTSAVGSPVAIASVFATIAWAVSSVVSASPAVSTLIGAVGFSAYWAVMRAGAAPRWNEIREIVTGRDGVAVGHA